MTSTLTSKPTGGQRRPRRASRIGSLKRSVSSRSGRGVGWIRFGLVAVALLVVGFAVWAVFFSAIFSARNIDVQGNKQVSDQDVLDAAAIPTDVPLLRLPLQQIADRIEQLDAVSTATVVRDWPDGVQVTVTERTPVAQVALAQGYGLIGSDGFLYRTESSAIRSLPVIDHGWATPVDGSSVTDVQGTDVQDTDVQDTDVQDTDDTMRAAVTVASSLPHSVRSDVALINADDPYGIELTMRNGAVVEWGSAASGLEKGQVLALLLRHPATTYNVTAPDAPTWTS